MDPASATARGLTGWRHRARSLATGPASRCGRTAEPASPRSRTAEPASPRSRTAWSRSARKAAGLMLCAAAVTALGLAPGAAPTPARSRPATTAGAASPTGPVSAPSAATGSSPATAPAATTAGWPQVCPADCPPEASGAVAHAPGGPPTRVRIPRVGIDSSLAVLGLDRTGGLEPPADYAEAGWFGAGPSPGDIGPAVIAGHVDSKSGPAVFHRLPEVRPGDRIEVRRGDRWIPFLVTATGRHAKDDFPTVAVYGPTPGPELRLITCAGVFNRRTGHYSDNLVVYAVADLPPAFPRSAAG